MEFLEELIEKGSAVLEHNKLEVQKITNSAFITNWNIKIDNVKRRWGSKWKTKKYFIYKNAKLLKSYVIK